MNRIYSLVWNRALHSVQVASELAHVGKGGGSASSAAGSMRRHPLALACVAALGLAVMALPAWSATCTTPVASATGANGTTGSDGNGTSGGTGATLGSGVYACIAEGNQVSGGYGGYGASSGGAGGAGGAGLTGSGFKLVSNGSIYGGDGGYGYHAAAGAGGAGVSGSGFTLTNNSGIHGGGGGSSYYGAGGAGGAGVYGSNITLVNSGSIRGGYGGYSGGDAEGAGGGQPPNLVGLAAVQPLDSIGSPGGSGYIGGAGGAGVVATGNSTITNTASGLIVGGEGGEGYSAGVGSTGYGGAGGAGVTGSGFKLTNQGEVGGGVGGAGHGVDGVNGSNGTGGAGGAAVSGSGFYVNNSAVLYGGRGGDGYAYGAATGGAGGAGIAGSGFTVVNSGLILGGRGGYSNVSVSGTGGSNGAAGSGYVSTSGAGGAGISVDNAAGAKTTITNAKNALIVGGEGGTAYEKGMAPTATSLTVIGNGGEGGAGIAIAGTGTTTVTNDGTLGGGYGGYAYVCNGPDCSTYTGNGGTGGAGVNVAGSGTTTITNTGDIYGGRGGNAWSYGPGGGGSYVQGQVGTGGAGINVSSTGTTTINNSGGIYGAEGGYGYGSLPGAGGAGVTGTGFTLTNSGGVFGGFGSDTGSAQGYRGGTGGAGVSGSGFTVTNTGLIQGGNGGGGSYSSGAGGAGVSGSAFSLTNSTGGTIAGGVGGSYSGCGPTSGAGGYGIDALGRVNITNAGSIMGGLSGDGTTQADAVHMSGGGNTLTLESGYSFTGNAVSTSGTTNGGDTLALGGTTNDTFDVSQIAATAPTAWTGTVQYYGFATYAKTGSSTWTLTNTTAAVTPWTLAGGVLQISSDTNLGAPSGGLTFNGGTLENTAAITSARDIAVTGTGTLQADADFTDSGAVSGSGTLTKTGAGTLTLNGNGSAFAGTLDVATGTLLVGGDGHASASLGGTTVVAAGATLGGFGTIGSMDLSGTLSPGASIGTLHASGDATFEPGSTYALDITAAGQSDQFASTGAVTIKGGTLQVQATGSNWAPITKYTIITATGGVSGQFSGISDLPTAHGGVLYGANAAYLVLGTDAFSLGNAAQTINQRNTAAGASSLGWGSQVFLAIAAQDAAAQRAALDQTSGEFHASQQAARVDDSRFVREQMDQRLRDGGAEDPAAKVPGTKLTAWVHGWGHWGQIDSDGNAAQMSDNGDGLLIGADLPVGSTGRVGVTGGASRSSLSVQDRSSWADVTQTWLGVYGGVERGAFAFRAGVAYAWDEVPAYRDVSLPPLAPERLSSDASGNTTTAYIEGAWKFQTSAGTYAPYLNLANVKVQTHASNETGGEAALHMDGGSMVTTLSTLGVRGNWQLASKLDVEANVGWQHAFRDVTPERTQQFLAGGDAFTVYGTPIAKNAAQVNVNLNWQVAPNMQVVLGYDGLYGGGVKDSAAKASFNVAF